MPFLLLLFLTLACLEDDWRTWDCVDSPPLSALLTWGGILAWTTLAALVTQRIRWQLARQPARRDLSLRRYGFWRFYHAIGLFVLYGVCLFLLGWGAAVQSLVGTGASLFAGSEFLILAPFVAGLILSWFFFYDAERALHEAGPGCGEPFWSRRAYLSFHLRSNAVLVFIPVLLLIVQKTVSRPFPESSPGWEGRLAQLFGITAALTVFVCIPWILRLVLGLKPIPEGPLRWRLIAVAGRLNFRCSDILLWNTRRGVANAMVAGVLPWPRYVLLTDRLVTDLSGDEVDAVFGHEIGHVKHHHMPYYAGFFVVSIIVLWLATALLLPDLEYLHKLAAFPLVAILCVYVFLVFGFLSRRCERQADIYGCRAVSCGRPDCTGHDENVSMAAGGGALCPTGIRTFINALERVAQVNGINRDRPGFLQSWQHSTIARRVEFLQTMLADETLERRFQRKVALVKWGLLLGLGAAMGLLVSIQGWN
jgi:Zn-dependent protease with chaperone function